jgi:hypothetical protein
MTARALRIEPAVPGPTVRLMAPETVHAEIIGAGVQISRRWIVEQFAPEHRVAMGRRVYWPEAEARAWWARYVKDRQGGA